jgi:glutamyl-Q tRNA(Asp) synthetase
LLNFNTPDYIHIPVITHADGDKLSKLTGAPAISLDAISKTLCDALDSLQQNPPPELFSAPLSDVWSWALENWQLEKLIACKAIVKTA